VGSNDGQPAATDRKRTAGAPVALKLTPLTGPAGFLADGSDVALLDVEAVDAQGERCPTFQQRVDFDFAGPGVWRGGYNSGRTNTINQPYLDLEAGINRVAVRSTATPGDITVTVRGAGLTPASLTLTSRRFATADGYALARPPVPAAPALQHVAAASQMAVTEPVAKAETGRYLASFSYSGRTPVVHVQQAARDGAKIYADRDYVFAGLPDSLQKSDWVQTANADKLYSAEDLIDLSLNVDAIVYVAHDRRLPKPGWLQRLFKATPLTLTVNNQVMNIYERHMHSGESLTLGSNTEDVRVSACNMYVVFLKRVDGELTAQR